MYRHQNSINDFYSHGYPLGFWAGPHAEELFINYNFIHSGSIFNISYSNASRGELTEQMLQDQYDNVDYDRYSNVKESISIFKFFITKPLNSGFDLHFGISDINWKNGELILTKLECIEAGLQNCENEPDDFVVIPGGAGDISKISLSIGFSYNFDIFNQTANVNQNSVSKTFLF